MGRIEIGSRAPLGLIRSVSIELVSAKRVGEEMHLKIGSLGAHISGLVLAIARFVAGDESFVALAATDWK